MYKLNLFKQTMDTTEKTNISCSSKIHFKAISATQEKLQI